MKLKKTQRPMTQRNKTLSPLFITFEGGEGAGKSTLIQNVKEYLEMQGIEVVTTREPGGSALGEQIRHWLLTQNNAESAKIDNRAELFLFLASRAQHIEEVIKPALAAGKVILCDRFNDSTIAYQGVARGLGLSQVESLCEFACNGTLPNLTFFLDIDPQEGLKRSKGVEKANAAVGALDRIESEKLEFHTLVRKGMQQLATLYPQRIQVIDGHQSKAQVFDEVREKILELESGQE